jgi:hypothetical protein
MAVSKSALLTGFDQSLVVEQLEWDGQHEARQGRAQWPEKRLFGLSNA